MRLAAVIIVMPLLLGSCAHKTKLGLPLVDSYSEAQQFAGQRVRIRGFWSNAHEATGIYFSANDVSNLKPRCLLPDRMLARKTGERIEVTGTIARGPCGTTDICLTICQPLEIELDASAS
ncbi:MAG: hypothetical protein ACKOPM_02525 [Novosphingobium sp.]